MCAPVTHSSLVLILFSYIEVKELHLTSDWSLLKEWFSSIVHLLLINTWNRFCQVTYRCPFHWSSISIPLHSAMSLFPSLLLLALACSVNSAILLFPSHFFQCFFSSMNTPFLLWISNCWLYQNHPDGSHEKMILEIVFWFFFFTYSGRGPENWTP